MEMEGENLLTNDQVSDIVINELQKSWKSYHALRELWEGIRSHLKGSIMKLIDPPAAWVEEQRTHNPQVVGANPTRRTERLSVEVWHLVVYVGELAQLVEQRKTSISLFVWFVKPAEIGYRLLSRWSEVRVLYSPPESAVKLYRPNGI